MNIGQILESLEDFDTASIDINSLDGYVLSQIIINCLRILEASEQEVYSKILRDGLGDEALGVIASLPEVHGMSKANEAIMSVRALLDKAGDVNYFARLLKHELSLEKVTTYPN